MAITINTIQSSKRFRSTTLKITNNRELELRTPRSMKIAGIAEFLSNNTIFLVKSLSIPKQNKIPSTILSGDTIYLFGALYSVVLEHAKRTTLQINKQDHIVSVQTRTNRLQRKKLYELLAPVLARHIEERIAVFESLVSQKKHHRIRLKYVKSLWGSCTTTGNLTFNLRLVHYPTEIIDYVVVHELSHLTHHNHSKVFWNLVRTHYPEVTEARRILKESRFG